MYASLHANIVFCSLLFAMDGYSIDPQPFSFFGNRPQGE